MKLTGHISQGQVVLDQPVSLPYGTLVRIELVDASDSRPSLPEDAT